MAPRQKSYCFTIDDNIRFLEQAAAGGGASPFEAPYLCMLRRLHREFGCKIQLNMFFSYAPGGFSLRDCPARFAQEFEKNADWLRVSFHARHNEPEFPYAGGQAALRSDFQETMQQLRRVFGERALAKTTTLHYVAAGRNSCRWLREQGVRGLIGMFYAPPGWQQAPYDLPPEEAALVRKENLWYDEKTDLFLARNQMIVNQLALGEIPAKLEEIRILAPWLFQFMIHEQYFYRDYEGYQPDFESKLRVVLEWCEKQGYRSCFLEDILRPIG